MKISLLMSLALIPSALFAQGYHITGHVTGWQDGDTLLIYRVSHTDRQPLAETVVRDGKFSFSGNQADPRGVYMLVKNSYGQIPFILDNSRMTFSGTAKKDTSDKIPVYTYDVSIGGSPLTDEMNEKLSVKRTLDQKYNEYHTKNASILHQLNVARAAKDSVELKRLVKSSAYQDFNHDEHQFFMAVDSAYEALYSANRDSWWGPFLMEATMNYFTDKDKPLYEKLTEKAKNTYYGKMVHEELYPSDNTGKKVPDFTLSDGKTLRDFLKGKKYVLIDFWASWCVPCRHEIPNLKKQYALYADKGLQIISISIDKDPGAWRKAKKEENMSWPGYLDQQGISSKYNVRFIPMMFLVDHEGRLISDKLRGEALATKLAELFR